MRLLLLILLMAGYMGTHGQTPGFHHLTTSNGLNDGSIREFAQDRYGYIWIGTTSGLNKYDGYSVKQFIHMPGDPNSIPQGGSTGIHCSVDGNIFFAFESGLVKYNYETNDFTRIRSDRNIWAGRMTDADTNHIWITTSAGLASLNTNTLELRFLSDRQKDSGKKELAATELFGICKAKDGALLCTSRRGLIRFDLPNEKIDLITVPGETNNSLLNVVSEKNGTVWFSFRNQPKLVRANAGLNSFKVYDYLFPSRPTLRNGIGDIMVDKAGKLWVTTVEDGLCYYEKENDRFRSYRFDPFRPSGVAANKLSALFQDRNDLIWVGSEGYGVSYFHPARDLFQIISPGITNGGMSEWVWARGADTDNRQQLWLATANGLIRYSMENKTCSVWHNSKDSPKELWSNSVRGVLYDSGKVYIATAAGMNVYDMRTGKMHFLDEKDSLPPVFYFSIMKDSRGIIWIACRDRDGLYYKEPGGKFRSASSHPVIRKMNWPGVRCLFEDSKKRIWIGMNGTGLSLYDPAKQSFTQWWYNESDSNSIAGDVVTGIDEDKDGHIWVSTMTGIAEYDENTKRFRQFNAGNKLPSLRTSGIRVDKLNRVWAGGTQGLMMLDQKRQNWKLFTAQDGLYSEEFADMPSATLPDGRFIFPSHKGFVAFDPEDLKEPPTHIETYISDIRIFNEPAVLSINTEELQEIRFKPKENFFSIELLSINYGNSSRLWYAYKLEGFDKDWIYTQQRLVNYTNVPGGEYRFLYKATTDPGNWASPGKLLLVKVGRVFYKTILFWALMVAFVFAVMYLVYRARLRKQQQIMKLENKARELEKEKTVMQYESLKQHLNPHFLFNSLTSLRSLIKRDPKQATGFLDSLSKVYRYVLRSGEHEVNTVKEELDFVETFVGLQKIRFGEGLQVKIQVDEALHARYLVPVTVQNLVENAIKHNTSDVETPLCIRIHAERDYLIVENNIQRYNIVETSNGKGLMSLRKLYEFYTDHPLLIIETTDLFIVKIPLL